MKVTLDPDALLAEGKISREEYRKIMVLSQKSTGSHALGILVSFGVLAVALGIGIIIPHYMTAVVLGAALSVAGFCLHHDPSRGSLTVSSILLSAGTLVFSGGLLAGTGHHSLVLATLSIILAVISLTISSSLLAALSPLYLAAAIGTSSAYEYASYYVIVSAPTVTVLLFSLLAYGAWKTRLILSPDDTRIVIVFARVCLLLVNIGFWVGSFWGGAYSPGSMGQIQPIVFTVIWALALLTTASWAARTNLRWTVNLCAVFGAILFYTKYFTYLSANPFSLLLAGLTAIGIAMTIAAINRNLTPPPAENSVLDGVPCGSGESAPSQSGNTVEGPGWSLPIVGSPSSQRLFP